MDDLVINLPTVKYPGKLTMMQGFLYDDSRSGAKGAVVPDSGYSVEWALRDSADGKSGRELETHKLGWKHAFGQASWTKGGVQGKPLRHIQQRIAIRHMDPVTAEQLIGSTPIIKDFAAGALNTLGIAGRTKTHSNDKNFKAAARDPSNVENAAAFQLDDQIHLHEQRGQYATLIHEGIHQLDFRDVRK